MRPTRRDLTLTATAAALAGWPGAAAAITADDRVMGSPRAKVVVYEYASVTCPHCARWQAEVWPAFKAKYVDTGKVRFVLRELPTEPAAIASAGFMVARCAPADKYFDVVDALFENQAMVFSNQAGAWMVQAGAKGGMTRDQVRDCATNQAGLDALNARVAKSEKEHPQVGSTPTFVIGNRTLVGEQPLEALDAVLQPLLRR